MLSVECYLVEGSGEQTPDPRGVINIAQGSRLALHIQGMAAVQGC